MRKTTASTRNNTHWEHRNRRGRTFYVHDVTKAVWRDAVWLQHFERSTARPYYEHSTSGATTWEPPVWVDVLDERSEKVYYVHSASGDTTWDAPEEWCPVILSAVPLTGRQPLSARRSSRGTASSRSSSRARAAALQRQQQLPKSASQQLDAPTAADIDARAALHDILGDLAQSDLGSARCAASFDALEGFVMHRVATEEIAQRRKARRGF